MRRVQVALAALLAPAPEARIELARLARVDADESKLVGSARRGAAHASPGSLNHSDVRKRESEGVESI